MSHPRVLTAAAALLLYPFTVHAQASIATNPSFLPAREAATQVADALDSHIAQIVIIGAGYDSRAWRFCREHVQFFELDQASTQSDKALRAPGPGPR